MADNLEQCDLCQSKNQLQRHRHFLEFRGNLASHLKSNIAKGLGSEERERDAVRDIAIERAMAWVDTMCSMYDEKVGVAGNLLTPWEARQQTWLLYRHQYYPAAKYDTPTKQKTIFFAFRTFLSASHTQHAHIWHTYLTDQYPHGITETNWDEFMQFLFAFRESAIDPENAHLMHPIATDRAIRTVAKGLFREM